MSSVTADELFRLECPPDSAKARVISAIQAEHRERDTRAMRDGKYAEVRARSFIAMAGETLVGVFDPIEDGATMEGVLSQLASRQRGDWVVTRGGRIVALCRTAMGGRRVVETFE
jgi:hypothetical protein